MKGCARKRKTELSKVQLLHILVAFHLLHLFYLRATCLLKSNLRDSVNPPKGNC